MVTIAVSVAICEIFSVKEWCDLENMVRVTIPACHGRTDGQTDRRTDRIGISISRVSSRMLARDKNECKLGCQNSNISLRYCNFVYF